MFTMHFGSGNVRDVNTVEPPHYERVSGSCPDDGDYTYTAYTTDCFGGQWLALKEDHTPGDISGNMLLVNSAHTSGAFLTTTINDLKRNTTYELAMWLVNVCKINSPCPSILLPNITILLQTPLGKTLGKFSTGEVARLEVPDWTRYRAFFITPPDETAVTLTMVNTNPGGCGNDFALDDITLRECVKPTPVVITKPKAASAVKKKPEPVKPVLKKATPMPLKTETGVIQTAQPQKDMQEYSALVLKPETQGFPNPPLVLTTRTNTLVKQIEIPSGEIVINLYDNGEIDGDTVSIYHNNMLIMAHARLSQKPVSFRIAVDANHPHHELIMVAENLGSIPPNTSLMIISAGTRRYEVFIASTETQNAKVVIDLKE